MLKTAGKEILLKPAGEDNVARKEDAGEDNVARKEAAGEDNVARKEDAGEDSVARKEDAPRLCLPSCPAAPPPGTVSVREAVFSCPSWLRARRRLSCRHRQSPVC